MGSASRTTSAMRSVGGLFCRYGGWFCVFGLVGFANGLFVLNVGVGERFCCVCGFWFRSMGNLGVGEGVPMVNLWNELVRSLVVALRASCSFFSSSRTRRASLSSSRASSIWESVAVRTALQNSAQSVCPEPVTFCRILGIFFRTAPIRRPFVSGIAAARRSTLSAHTTCANSSTPFTFTRFPTSSSVIVVRSNAACFSSTVFTVGGLVGHLFANEVIRCSQVSLSPKLRPSHH